MESKNENTGSVSREDQQENEQLISVINFIEQTMKTLVKNDSQKKLSNCSIKTLTLLQLKQISVKPRLTKEFGRFLQTH